MADDLLALVLAGTKTATCWSVAAGPPPAAIGEQAIVLDSAGRDRVVVETVGIEQCRFDAVGAAFAFAEGEGDRSLAQWRAGHRRFFERNGGFDPAMPLWCERFRLIAVLPMD
ncbi:MAG: ASCH domain-containing protein [Sphingomonadaceae bacterium]|nr:ASCH domain-containing protein [Sphingomonadaceae bacterium]